MSEEIVSGRRQVDMLQLYVSSLADAVRQIGVTAQTSGQWRI
ncbi:hypothetical protein [Roseovarius nanhaiticus]|nr:hypothetical protein [Roseovarius nanhaiticus]